MLEGLEVSVIQFKNINDFNEIFRYDAEYFRKEPMRIMHEIRKKAHFRITEKFDVSKLAGFEFTSYFTKQNMESEDSYIAMTSKNIQTERMELKDFIKIDKKVANINLTRSKLFKNDIVLSYTGEYRRSLVLFENDYQLGPNVCRIRPKIDKDISFYVSTFFNSKIGQIILDKEKTLSAQPTVAMSRIREIPIPYFEKLITEIKNLITNQYILLEKSLLVYSKAEKILFEEIELHNFNLCKDSVNIKSFKESFQITRRLDAEYYQKKYEEYSNLIYKYRNGFDKLVSICNLKDNNFKPLENKLYKYIELSNIGKSGEVTGYTEEFGKDLPSRARRIVNTGDVVISSIEGSLQSCAIISEAFDKSLCSTGLYVINSDKINSETLLVLFKSEPIQGIMKQNCSGTILTAMNKDEFLNIPIPLIDLLKQDQIAELVEESFKLKTESERLLEIAKKAVEIAIETDEQTAINFIKDNEI